MVGTLERKFISPKQAAKDSGLTLSSVMKMIRAEEVKAEKWGWFWMIPVSEIPKLKSSNKK